MKLSENIDRMYIVSNKRLFTDSPTIVVADYYGFLFIVGGENLVLSFLHGDIDDLEISEIDMIPFSIDSYIEIEKFPHAKKDIKTQNEK